MDVYQISLDLKPGIRDHQFVAALEGYLGHLKADGKIESWRLLRRKLGLGLAALGEFQILIETRDLAQLDAAFTSVSRRNEPIEVQNGPSIHDCMITKNYVIVMDLPVTFSMNALISGESFPYRWNEKHKARIGLLPREGKGSDIIWCDIEPCYIFHPANAFETADGKVIMDAAVHADMFNDAVQGPNSKSTPFERLTIDPVAKKVSRKVIDASPQEFPRPDERRTGKPYRYAYTLALPEGGDTRFLGDSRLYKHDLEAGTREVHDFGQGKMPGEFVFVPKRADSGEDDGWLVGFVIDTERKTTDFVILDARNFTGAPQATITIPVQIPPGFHGNFIPLA